MLLKFILMCSGIVQSQVLKAHNFTEFIYQYCINLVRLGICYYVYRNVHEYAT